MGRSQRISSALLVHLCLTSQSAAFTPGVRSKAVIGASRTRCHVYVNNKPVKASASEGPSKLATTRSHYHSQLQPFWDLRNGHVEVNGLDTTSTKHVIDREKEKLEKNDKHVIRTTSEINPNKIILPTVALLLAAGLGLSASMGWTVTDVYSSLEHFVANPQGTLQGVIDGVQAMGPIGVVYFGIFYLLAEILAVPATPLTLSAGYLFGMTEGVGVVLTAATIAASIAFFIGKTFLRSWVEGILDENPRFSKLDKAIGEQGFKLLLLVRLSPIFPFALSNYVYGASSIGFPAYFWGTLVGFTPGTIAYVYTGMVGKELMLGGDGAQPWYMYAAGFAVLSAFLKLLTDVASGIVESIDDDQPTSSS